MEIDYNKFLKISKNFASKASRFLFIFLIITGWIFSGFPQIWQNPPITNLSTILFLTGIFVFATLWVLTPPALTFVGAGFVFVLKS